MWDFKQWIPIFISAYSCGINTAPCTEFKFNLNNMPSNRLFIIKRNYNFLHSSSVNVERSPCVKSSQDPIVFSVKDVLLKEAVIKRMIAALEDNVKVLEKKVEDLKKISEQKDQNLSQSPLTLK